MERNKPATEAAEYLHNKYRQDFVCRSAMYPGIDIPYEEYVFSPALSQETYLTVRRNGTVFSDSYYGVLISQSYRRKLEETIGGVFSFVKCYFTFRSAAFPDSLTDPETMEDALKQYPDSFYSDILLIVPETESVDPERKTVLRERMQKANLSGIVSIYALSEQQIKDCGETDCLAFLLRNPRISAIDTVQVNQEV